MERALSGHAATERIEGGQAVGLFSVVLVAGRKYDFELAATPSSGRSVLGIYSRAGWLVANTWSHGARSASACYLTFTPPTTGTYYIATAEAPPDALTVWQRGLRRRSPRRAPGARSQRGPEPRRVEGRQGTRRSRRAAGSTGRTLAGGARVPRAMGLSGR